MAIDQITLTYIGGPTLLLEWAGVRFLTDPTFDAAGTDYPTPVYTLHKTMPPALLPEALGRVDAVLLSHDHHFDNLDNGGREFLKTARTVFTTAAGAERLGGNAAGFEPGVSRSFSGFTVTATPARHGPPGGDRGPVVGFVLEHEQLKGKCVYLSGDTVWYEGVAGVAGWHDIALAVLFSGAARVREVGPAHLTFTAAETVEAAHAFSAARILPVHYEGWTHFTESRPDIEAAFAAAGIPDRLIWPAAGKPTSLKL